VDDTVVSEAAEKENMHSNPPRT